ncbi:MAG: glycosyltransferase family 4 protein [Deltaproteobacteria bacterium]|nr:glycosyltransferase family 4 protein [Deltaproteobacteria bacterium]
MKVLMLGWEYPPHISGGLGTACEGLTKGLARLGVRITFVVPQLMGGEDAPHMVILDSYRGFGKRSSSKKKKRAVEVEETSEEESIIEKIKVPAALSPYWRPEEYERYIARFSKLWSSKAEDGVEEIDLAKILGKRKPKPAAAQYGSNIFEEVEQYATNVVAAVHDSDFDLIHGHDWMTYPAAIALKRITGKPLVLHIHSLEYDRSGSGMNPRIRAIEEAGMQAADLVISVSHYTKSMVNWQYKIPLEKICPVHNGIYPKKVTEHHRASWAVPRKIVLFLGRVTYQKGPDFFVEVAPRVIPHVPNVLFVMAGTGDMLPRLMRRVSELGLSRHFHFAGFLKGKQVDRMLSISDLYVMPSVSEPFGLSALEAINFNTPALISRQSGVSEVVEHALKYDFWDMDRLADLMVNALLHDELRAEMAACARHELGKLRWDASAEKTVQVYKRALQLPRSERPEFRR